MAGFRPGHLRFGRGPAHPARALCLRICLAIPALT